MPALKLPADYADGGWFSFDQTVLVGREREADLLISHPSVSRRHARIVRAGDSYSVIDLQSANGTFLNGRPVLTTLPLQDGDRLSFGGVDAVFSAGAPPGRSDSDESGLWPSPLPPPERGSRTRSHTRTPQDSVVVPGHLGPAVTFFFKLAQVTSANVDVDALLSFVVAEIFGLVSRAARAGVLTLDGSTGGHRVRLARTRFGKAAAFNVDDLMRGGGLGPGTSDRGSERPAEPALVTIGGRSTISIPLVFDRQSYGFLIVDDGGSGTALKRSDLHLLRAVAQPVAQALAYAWLRTRRLQQSLLEHDLQLARKIQQQFLPSRPPEIHGFDVSVAFLPALDVGGDFYDFLQLEAGRTAFVIGDVSGKGVSAALYAARISSDLRYLAPTEVDPAALLTELDDRVSSLAQDGMFVTAALGILDAADGSVSVASAGHPLPLVRKADGTLRSIGVLGGVPLGIGRSRPYISQRYDLEPGETLVFYTDGIVDAADAKGAPFGLRRFEAAISPAHHGAAELQQRLLAAINDFVGERPRFDDIIAIFVTRHAASRRRSGSRSAPVR